MDLRASLPPNLVYVRPVTLAEMKKRGYSKEARVVCDARGDVLAYSRNTRTAFMVAKQKGCSPVHTH